jgi:nucleoside-diphosphate-sugar epimerase
MKDNEIHVIFGTGPVGLAAMEELLQKGKKIRMINHRGKGVLPPGVELRKGEAANPFETVELCRGATVVYNCANPPYTMWPEIFPVLQRGIIEGAAAAKAKLVVMENLYMYGVPGGQPLSEDTPFQARDRKGKTRAQMAMEILEVHRSGKVRTASARASDFFGPRVLASVMGEKVFYPAIMNEHAQIIGQVDQLHTYTYIRDIGKALVVLGEREEALGQAWHEPSAETKTTRQFDEKIYGQTGYDVKIRILSKFMATFMGTVNPTVRELAEIFYQYERPLVVDHSKYVTVFGNHATPLAEAIRTTLEWYRKNPRS